MWRGLAEAESYLFFFIKMNIKWLNELKSTDYRTLFLLLISRTGSSRVFDSGFCRSCPFHITLHISGSLWVPAAAARCSRRGTGFWRIPVRTLNVRPTARQTEEEKPSQAGCHCWGKKAKLKNSSGTHVFVGEASSDCF